MYFENLHSVTFTYLSSKLNLERVTNLCLKGA